MSSSSIPNFGIAWEITIDGFPDSNGNIPTVMATGLVWTPEPLHITFETYQTYSSAFWFADIALFNLNDPTTQTVLQQGMTVTLKAGFQANQPLSIIFQGTLLQPLWEKIDAVEQKLTLHCVVGLVEQTNNFVAGNASKGLLQREIVSRMASTSAYPLDTTNTAFNSTIRSSRGTVYFGQPIEMIKKYAEQSQMNLWITNLAINARQLKTQTTNIPTIQYTPQTGLIGTPQQTQEGADIRVLLDSRATIGTQFQIVPTSGTTIRQLTVQQGNYQTVLDAQGIYIIVGVRHVGDSRGNQWFSELTGVNFNISNVNASLTT